MTTYALSCHCGAIRLEVDADLNALRDCNCSVCVKYGFLHWYVPKSALRLITHSRAMSSYLYRDAGAARMFCPICGVAMMYTGYPDDKVSLNARCIDGIDVFSLNVTKFDGLHRP